ncbi:histidinol-phosphate transaminase [uncultured Subdoligranulum sp.]|uniref:pyridoxal phosphate-dependent aminotransferase n=1 Tax=uncultured Subdoligranulum sp. TaxID=512298 RepID=UPI002623E109|nr:threonine-phosphate decarboxylase [uncultured Subdoligranulum sp.]
MHLVHGGDWAGYEAEYGRSPLDFSANVSPLGVPTGVQAAIAGAAAAVDRYPDPLCRALRTAIAEAEKLPPEWILCGNGAADLIWRLAAAKCPQEALLPVPSFAEYEAALRSVGCQVTHHVLSEQNDFLLDDSFLESITPKTQMVFLCEPNNPTGRTTPMPLLQAIVHRCREVGAILVVDECFGDFLDKPAAHTLIPLLEGNPHLVILKAFTKLYAMAGARLGYALCADSRLLGKLYQTGSPWSVSSLAQAAGCAALQEKAYVQRVRALIQVQRPLMSKGLQALGLRVVLGEANYLLFQCAVPLVAPLRERGILLRSCGNYPGLDDTWYRTAVRTESENCCLLAALREILR